VKRLHIAVVYNAYTENQPEMPEDRGGTEDLRLQMKHIARTLRKLGHTVTILPLAHDLFAFQRRDRDKSVAAEQPCQVEVVGLPGGIGRCVFEFPAEEIQHPPQRREITWRQDGNSRVH